VLKRDRVVIVWGLMMLRRRVSEIATVVLALTVAISLLAAVQVPRDFDGETLLSDPLARSQDGAFHFCRVRFLNSPEGDGDGWFVDFPRADVNLTIRLAELTRAHVSFDARNNPMHQVVSLTDPGLFRCAFAMMSEPGGAYFSADEADALRRYLLKGGFLWVDDFWGNAAWEWWARQLGKALPAHEYPIFDVPIDHPIFHTLFDIGGVPQIPNIGLWIRAGLTSERGRESAEVHFRGISDHRGRLMVVMSHNTDFGDAYERESDNPDYFQRFSVPGYALGINIVLYALMH
jgi:hypothetical protein